MLLLAVALTGCNSEKTAFSEDVEKVAVGQLVEDYFRASYTIDYSTWDGEAELQYATDRFAEKLKMIFPEYRKSFAEIQLTEKFDSIEIGNISFDSDTSGKVECAVQGSGTENGVAFSQTMNYLVEVKKVRELWLIENYYVQETS
ncbi:hypothetical protein Desdi_0634 [Desulfitobacterium dichloroeliminans LMG P-21439]|uniref:SnoaL-like domain-containing protein n=1 Tax=Desulfitobacterium dichloroeliminans (strain LMG P-21439 / DCA1) TaxID=871963 RepID=L0F5E4_DESDL|nr:hypothetical protein [Desulfitobacterium dichloroeliminans]AGA68163.1 hypothetical protein Desdi_0634 [Desulfitobacterium dichloroeliminans LMG P-21439]